MRDTPATGWRETAQDRISESIFSLVESGLKEPCDIVLVFPPFGSPDRPSLGLELIAQIARSKGFSTAVIYSNLSFAKVIGVETYRSLCHTPTEYLVGERLFALSGPDNLPRCRDLPDCWDDLPDLARDDFHTIQDLAVAWTDSLCKHLVDKSIPILGATTVFEQTRAALAILDGIKTLSPSTRTLLGGANAEAEMGMALAAVARSVDHIFSGESEHSFSLFLDAIAGGHQPDRVIAGRPLHDMNSLAAPDYRQYFHQLSAVLDKRSTNDFDGMQLRLPYESSRGCWWGEKHHCTFCGLNAEGMTHRTKDPEKVLSEVVEMVDQFQVDRVLMVDNIMPHAYFSTLLPELAKTERRISLFYEQKSNLSLHRMRLLRNAGIDEIQPGIESLSTSLLRRMRKGSTAQTGINCLRYARATGIKVAWNLLCDFPEDNKEDYQEMLALIPLLGHLQPPGGVSGLSIDRFSPYFNAPEQFGISKVSPLVAYDAVFPGEFSTKIAYHFSGSYSSAIRTEANLHASLTLQVDRWTKSWTTDPPFFCIANLSNGDYLALDTRGIGALEAEVIDRHQASILLNGCPSGTEVAFAALDNGRLADVDGRWLGLAVSDPEAPLWA